MCVCVRVRARVCACVGLCVGVCVCNVGQATEAMIVIRDILRKYPNKYEHIIGTLCENLDTLDNTEAKACMIWIIGEYAERIDNAAEVCSFFRFLL